MAKVRRETQFESMSVHEFLAIRRNRMKRLNGTVSMVRSGPGTAIDIFLNDFEIADLLDAPKIIVAVGLSEIVCEPL
jgi:hypothetical protein